MVLTAKIKGVLKYGTNYSCDYTFGFTRLGGMGYTQMVKISGFPKFTKYGKNWKSALDKTKKVWYNKYIK